MISNFTLQDIFGVFSAFCIFPLIIIFPGYICGWTFNLFEFRTRLLPSRFAISLLLSFAISPIFFYLTTRWFSLTIALVITALFACASLILVVYEKPILFKGWPQSTILWVVAGWLVLATFSLVDLQWGKNELYFSVASYDHTTRVSIVDAITRTGVPPINPSYYPGHYVQLTFLYFFWYILGSLVDMMGGSVVDARTALYGSVLWCGIALMSAIAFYLRQRNGRNEGKIWKQALIGISLLAVTGLDILPALAIMRYADGTVGDFEHWNEQITAWVGSLLWVPHHVASLISAFVGVMLVHSVRGNSRKTQFVALTFAGVAFASAIGLSVWVTFIFVIFWGFWMLSLFVQKTYSSLFLPMLFAGVIALLLAGPFLMGLIAGSSGGNPGGALPIALTVRSFSLVDAFTGESSPFTKLAIRLIFLPINYIFELGLFFLVGIIWIKTNKVELFKNPYYFAEALLLLAAFFVGTFTRSTLIENNDLGWRAWLPGQFILLIWGVDVLEGFSKSSNSRFFLPPKTRYNLVLLAAIGISSTILDITLLRFAYYFAFGSEAGQHIYSARQAYTTINKVLPKDAIVQYNPSSFINRPSGLYGMRQSAISDRTAYGVPLDEYYAKVAAISEIFDLRNIQTWDPVDNLCKKYSIEVIVIVENDPVWEALPLLKQQRDSLYADNHYAVFLCGGLHFMPNTP